MSDHRRDIDIETDDYDDLQDVVDIEVENDTVLSGQQRTTTRYELHPVGTRAELDRLRALLAKHGGHTGNCWARRQSFEDDDCKCGWSDLQKGQTDE